MANSYVVSVAEARGFDTAGNLLFIGKTLLDSSLDVKVAQTDVRGGFGAPLLLSYFHSSDANLTVTDAQWNLAYLALQTGNSVGTGKNIFKTESVTLTAGAGTVSGTPLAAFGTSLYGWCELSDGTTERVTFTGSNFTSTQQTGTILVTYYVLDSAAKTFTVPSNIVPNIIRLVLDVQLMNAASNSSVVGKVQIEIPRATLTGSWQIQMKMDSVSSTPLNIRALADYTSGTGKLLDITEVVTGAKWYTDIVALSVVGGDQSLATTLGTMTLDIRAIPAIGAAFKPPYADLDFVSGTPAKATVSAAGLVTGVAAGTTLINVKIHDKATVDTSATITVP